MSEQLTDKQKYQREYYANNKEQICAKKRSKYSEKNSSKINKENKKPPKPRRKRKSKITPTSPSPATSPVVHVDKLTVTTRHTIEDLQLAREYGISVEDLK